MGHLADHFLSGVGHVLGEVGNWIPERRWKAFLETTDSYWAWPVMACLMVGGFSLVGALWVGEAWLYRLMTAGFVGAFGLINVLAAVTSPSHRR